MNSNDDVEAAADERILMQYTATAKVFTEYVNAYLDEGWVIVNDSGGGRDELRAARERAGAAEAAIRRVRYLLDATDPGRYAILSMEGLRAGILSAIEEGEPA